MFLNVPSCSCSCTSTCTSGSSSAPTATSAPHLHDHLFLHVLHHQHLHHHVHVPGLLHVHAHSNVYIHLYINMTTSCTYRDIFNYLTAEKVSAHVVCGSITFRMAWNGVDEEEELLHAVLWNHAAASNLPGIRKSTALNEKHDMLVPSTVLRVFVNIFVSSVDESAWYSYLTSGATALHMWSGDLIRVVSFTAPTTQTTASQLHCEEDELLGPRGCELADVSCVATGCTPKNCFASASTRMFTHRKNAFCVGVDAHGCPTQELHCVGVDAHGCTPQKLLCLGFDARGCTPRKTALLWLSRAWSPTAETALCGF